MRGRCATLSESNDSLRLGTELERVREGPQLSTELQGIVEKYRENFERAPLTANHYLGDEATDTDEEQHGVESHAIFINI